MGPSRDRPAPDGGGRAVDAPKDALRELLSDPAAWEPLPPALEAAVVRAVLE